MLHVRNNNLSTCHVTHSEGEIPPQIHPMHPTHMNHPGVRITGSSNYHVQQSIIQTKRMGPYQWAGIAILFSQWLPSGMAGTEVERQQLRFIYSLTVILSILEYVNKNVKISK